ncbi:MAG: cytochrome b/b6 domain-containing protein [Gammaproteobacteria bacterium]|nr:cytochrome b/b6 domain-containing protein [Gammaproteobacteria bacterium]MCF6231220.1 cytochrome b/b6 domain-containing protein [Gammaproteobacteria bacterium]
MAEHSTTQIKVWDGLVRGFHWLVLLSFVAAYLTSQFGMQQTHILIGYLIALLLVVRIAWGFVGSQHARFADFIATPTEVWRYLKASFRNDPPHYLGHNPAGGWMVLVLMGALLLMAISGVILVAVIEFEGPLLSLLSGMSDQWAYRFSALHEWVLDLLWLLIVGHLLGVVVASIQHKENLPHAMVTGYKTINKGEGKQ